MNPAWVMPPSFWIAKAAKRARLRWDAGNRLRRQIEADPAMTTERSQELLERLADAWRDEDARPLP